MIIFFVLAIILLACLVFVFIDILRSADNASSSETSPAELLAENLATNSRSAERELAERIDRPYFGNPDAKIVIVEFSDFLCPVCQSEFPIIRKVMAERKEDIFFIYRNFPTISENSITVANASLCAQAQDKFWAVHDRLFMAGKSDFSRDDLLAVAKQTGLNETDFAACLDAEDFLSKVLDDVRDAASLGVSGTPTFFINGNKITGAVTEAQWKQIIDYSLSVVGGSD